jgi:hypothetical protein
MCRRDCFVFLDVLIDGRVLAFTLAVAAATSLLFGAVPALRAAHVPPIEALREQGRSATESGPQHARCRGPGVVHDGCGGRLAAGQASRPHGSSGRAPRGLVDRVQPFFAILNSPIPGSPLMLPVAVPLTTLPSRVRSTALSSVLPN